MQIVKKISSKVYRRFRYLLKDLAATFGLYHHLFKSARGSRIMVYHGVCKQDATRFNTLFVTERVFEKQLQFYKKYFHVLSSDDFFQKKFNPDKFNICLSFDDGFANNYHYVLPLLEKYNLPATFFVTAIRKEGYNILWNDFLTIASVNGPDTLFFRDEVFVKQKGRTYISRQTKTVLAETLRYAGFETKTELMELLLSYNSFPDDDIMKEYWLQMSVEEIRLAAASPFITIGSHGYYHNDFGKIPISDTARELQESKSFLETVTGKPVTQIAFPYGTYSDEAVNEALKAGYGQLYAVNFSSPQDKEIHQMRERMGINPFISVNNQMLSIIKGTYE